MPRTTKFLTASTGKKCENWSIFSKDKVQNNLVLGPRCMCACACVSLQGVLVIGSDIEYTVSDEPMTIQPTNSINRQWNTYVHRNGHIVTRKLIIQRTQRNAHDTVLDAIIIDAGDARKLRKQVRYDAARTRPSYCAASVAPAAVVACVA